MGTRDDDDDEEANFYSATQKNSSKPAAITSEIDGIVNDTRYTGILLATPTTFPSPPTITLLCIEKSVFIKFTRINIYSIEFFVVVLVIQLELSDEPTAGAYHPAL